MTHFIVFMFALFTINAARADDIICDAGSYLNGTECVACPDEYPHSDAGATSLDWDCYSDEKIRDCTDYLPDGCAGATYETGCTYVDYHIGLIKSGCTSCAEAIPTSVSALPGYFVNGGITCTPCPAGTYNNDPLATTCTPCPAGTYSESGATDISACVPCPAGQYSSIPGGQCITCPNGTYSMAGATECIETCPSGTYAATSSQACITCPDTFPNSEPGAIGRTKCYSNTKTRDCSTSHFIPIGCEAAQYNVTSCEYVAYAKAFGLTDGTIKSGCASCDDVTPTSVTAMPGFRVNGLSCEMCQPGTYSPGGNATTCNACPNGATTFAGATSRDECMRILNYLPTGQTTPTKIYMGMKQNTHPAFAAKIGDDVFYANMTPVDAHDTPGLYVAYNNQSYVVQDNKIDNGTKYPFFVTTTPDTTTFKFTMSAAGNFTVDWGDGAAEKILRGDTSTVTTYSHTYATPGEYTIGFGGRASAYNTQCTVSGFGASKKYSAAIGFSSNTHIAGISGTLADMFPTINGINPGFYGTFTNCSNLTGQIPAGLFADFTGTPHSCMFQYTFNNTPNLTGPTARTVNGTRLYDIEYNGEKWIDAYPSAFSNMYTGSGIDTND